MKGDAGVAGRALTDHESDSVASSPHGSGGAIDSDLPVTATDVVDSMARCGVSTAPRTAPPAIPEAGRALPRGSARGLLALRANRTLASRPAAPDAGATPYCPPSVVFRRGVRAR